MKKFIYLLGSFWTLMSCGNWDGQSKNEMVAEVDFHKFIAIGESYSAGNVQSPALQQESPMAIIAAQFAKVGGGTFKIPLNAIAEDVSGAGPYQNLAVPSTSSYHVMDKAFSAKSVYFRNLSTSDSNSILDEVLMQTDRSFFSIWIGGNDLVQYASQGGLGVVRRASDPLDSYNPMVKRPDGSQLTIQDLTAPETFDSIYTFIVDQFMKNGSNGALASLSNVLDLPFFTSVNSKPIKLTKKEADELNLYYKKYNDGLKKIVATSDDLKAEIAQRLIVFKEGADNGAVIIDEDLSSLGKLPKYRQSNARDIILLTAMKGLSDPTSGLGRLKPMDDPFVLSPAEIEHINQVTAAYNSTIQRIAKDKKLAYVNLDSLMGQLKSPNGLVHEGVKYTSGFEGGFFSKDALPNSRGNAFIGNEFIKAINQRYHSKVPLVNPNEMPNH